MTTMREKFDRRSKKLLSGFKNRAKVFPLRIRRFCSRFNTVGKNATFCRKSFFNLNEVFPYKRRMQLKISTEKYWKKAAKKLLNVQKCWKIFFLQKTCFSFFFAPTDTKNANLTTLLKIFWQKAGKVLLKIPNRWKKIEYFPNDYFSSNWSYEDVECSFISAAQ